MGALERGWHVDHADPADGDRERARACGRRSAAAEHGRGLLDAGMVLGGAPGRRVKTAQHSERLQVQGLRADERPRAVPDGHEEAP
eukprot:7837880-Alexandrium_andersonii.AAC.1